MNTGDFANRRAACAAAVCIAALAASLSWIRAETSFVEGLGAFSVKDSAVDSAGFTYLVGVRNGQGHLMKIDQAGGVVMEKTLSGSTTSATTFLPVAMSIGFELPQSVANLVGPVDAVYIASAGAVILIDPDGSTVAAIPVSSDGRSVRDVVYSPLSPAGTVTGAVYVGGTKGSEAFVARLAADLSGAIVAEKEFGNNPSGDAVNSVVVDELGDVYAGGSLAAGRNQLGELGLGNVWSVRIYQKAGVTVNNFSAAQTVINTGSVVASASPSVINYRNNFPGGRRNDFVMVATTTFYVPQDTNRNFYISSDDGQRLYVDNVLIYTDDALHGETERDTGTVSLSAGFHTIRYETFERSGDEAAKLHYSDNGGTTKLLLTAASFGGNTGFVFKFSPDLSTLRAHFLTSYERGTGGEFRHLDYSRGWVYATGFWNGISDLRDDSATGKDIETVKLDSALRMKGRATVKGSSDLRGHRVDADEVGNVYLTGTYGPASADFDGDGGTTFVSKSASVESRFYAKLNSNMEYVWVQTEKAAAPNFTTGVIDTTATWNETIQRLVVTGEFTGNGSLTYGNPGLLESVVGGQGFLVVFEPDGSFTLRVDLTVISQYGVSRTQIRPFGGTPALPRTEPRIKGSQITVSVPEAIYQDINGAELNDPTRETIRNIAEIRFKPTGYTLSDGTITDDGQFVYSALLQSDLTVTFNWVTEYALTIDLDLAGTRGTVLGELASPASGRPDPTVQKHWLGRGEQAAPEIDGVISGIEAAGGSIRYLVVGYHASGPPNTNVAPSNFAQEDFFPFPTVEQRHKVAPFTMEGPAKVTWVLIKQNGIQVSTTGPASIGLPLIEVVADPAQRLNLGLPPQQNQVGAGTFYFDEHSSIRILTVASEGTQQVRGWIGGDGVVFPSSGPLSSLGSFSVGGKVYRGIEVFDLIRPARVMWDYGDRIYEETVRIGSFVTFSGLDAAALGRIRMDLAPDRIDLIDGPNGSVVADMVEWDGEGRKLYPMRPGEVLSYWRTNDVDPSLRIIIRLFLLFPIEPHYRHVASTPGVNLDPSPDDLVAFREVKYTENNASVGEDNRFFSDAPGRTVLKFGELNDVARGQQHETFRVRVVETKLWTDGLPPVRNVPIGAKVTSPYDTAELDTGYVFFPLARYNPFVHNRTEVTGPVIPVNREFEAAQDYDLTVVWYEKRDELLWPYQAERLNPVWPTAAQGLKRIVIASEFGSDSVSAEGLDQEVVGPVTVDVLDAEGAVIGQETIPPATTYDPSRFQQLQIYIQPVVGQAGYNPNEEHALIAPSRRFATASPLPGAAFALRNNDLNITTQTSAYTSDPYVLTQFFDVLDGEFKMGVYAVVREANRGNLGPRNYDYRFSVAKPIEAGKPVIPFYPLGQVIGATPCPETFGLDLNPAQLTYWEDHKGGSWSVSGGDDARFQVYFYYPLQPDFWWPPNGIAGTNPFIGAQNVGDCLPFLPNFSATGETSFPNHKPTAITRDSNDVPQPITYQSEWPVNTPVLKVGETVTFAGGEFKADNPSVLVPDGEGGVREEETPGMPGVLAWAAGEVVYDDLNPDMDDQEAFDVYTARIYQALEERSVTVERDSLPVTFQPANTQIIRVREGKWFFAELPASLQKRVSYDPITEKLAIHGLLNDKEIGDPTLTAAPPPLYVLEPNLMTPSEVTALAELALENFEWQAAVAALYKYSRNPALLDKDGNGAADASGQDRFLQGLAEADDAYRVGLERKIDRDAAGDPIVLTDGVVSTVGGGTPVDTDGDGMDDAWETRFFGNLSRDGTGDFDNDGLLDVQEYINGQNPTNADTDGDGVKDGLELFTGIQEFSRSKNKATQAQALGVGLALSANPGFLDPVSTLPDISFVTIAENNHPSLGGSPVSLFVIKVDRNQRFRGAIKTILSDNVFDENIVIRHQGDFAANAEDLVFEWWYRVEDGRTFPPPDLLPAGTPNPWKLFTNPQPIFPDNSGRAFSQLTLRGSPNAPEILLSDTLFFVRYRHFAEDDEWVGVPFEWAGAANSSPKDNDLDGMPDYRPQLVQGWIKRVLDAVNPYEARIRDFTGDNPATWSSMVRQLGAPFVGPVALNPAKNVIENVGLIELYETILQRALDLTVRNGIPVTPGLGNAIQLASTRLLDFYTLLGNEAYVDSLDPTIGISGGSISPAVFAFQNQVADLAEEELALLRGQDNDRGRPFYNRLFPNFTKGEGEPAYAVNYNLQDANTDGFIDESDALLLYPHGHGDAWGHYLTALKTQYDLLREPLYNWETRSELYNLLDVVIEVDFRDERKFAATAAAKAKAGAEVVDLTYRSKYVENPGGQWQGYTDSDAGRGWGVEEWARRAGQGAYFDWITANALLPAAHPNLQLEGIQKVDRTTNKDIGVISANLTHIQQVFDNANAGINPAGVAGDTVPFDINPILYYAGYVIDDEGREGHTHFEQIYTRALTALKNAMALYEAADAHKARLREVSDLEDSFQREVFEQDLNYRKELIEIFGTPYLGTIGSGKLYPAGYEGPDLITWMYADVREITAQTVPGPTVTFGGSLVFDSSLGRYSYDGGGEGTDYSFIHSVAGDGSGRFLYNNGIFSVRGDFRDRFAPTFIGSSISDFRSRFQANADVNYTGDASRRVDLQNFTLPMMARGFTFQAPPEWGIRRSPGKLQNLVHEMLQQEAALASSVAAWDAFQGGLWRQIELFNAKFDLDITIRAIDGGFLLAEEAANGLILGFKAASAANEIIAEALGDDAIHVGGEAVPKNLPTGGLAVSPGDSLAPIRAAFAVTGSFSKAGFTATKIAWDKAVDTTEFIRDLAKHVLEFTKDNLERDYGLQEALVGLENMIGDEAKLRIEIFKELDSMRQKSEEFRTAIADGQRLIDEREAYNKRVAVLAQRNRYQDMTFRVARSAALQNYRSAFDLAVRYAYLAGKAYDYETSLPDNHAASALPILSEIVGARYLGALDGDGNPELRGGLAGQMAQMKANFAVLRNQLGFANPSNELSRFSIRSELLRLTDDDEGSELWREALSDATPGTGFYVDDLWALPEFRRHCRPFVPLSGGAQPALVLSFSTSIRPGENVFGLVQAGGDHTFNASNFATKIRSVGVWFEGYDNTELTQTPRVYMIPAGTDFQRMPYSDDFNPRSWNLIDSRIPVPYPITSAAVEDGTFIPLVDSLSEPLGEPRRHSMFRAYHSDPDVGTDEFDDSEVIWNTRLGGRSVWNNRWLLIIPGLTLHADPEEGLRTFIHGPVVDPETKERDPSRAVRDIRILLDHFGFSGN
ncbi:MAG TPA: PA14 domain-containing protein [Verrucomicrobiales bacterium]|nr:PA14 domain-containing protein [Verrucomicrobiales bacterium]